VRLRNVPGPWPAWTRLPDRAFCRSLPCSSDCWPSRTWSCSIALRTSRPHARHLVARLLCLRFQKQAQRGLEVIQRRRTPLRAAIPSFCALAHAGEQIGQLAAHPFARFHNGSIQGSGGAWDEAAVGRESLRGLALVPRPPEPPSPAPRRRGTLPVRRERAGRGPVHGEPMAGQLRARSSSASR
jgi:hypothetical protein